MTDIRNHKRGFSLTSRFLMSSIITYALLAVCFLIAWNVGTPWLGVPGHASELLRKEEKSIRYSLTEKLAYSAAWLSSREMEVRCIARSDASILLSEVTAVEKSTGEAETKRRREWEARYRSLCEETEEISRVLVLRRADGKILADSFGTSEDSALFPDAPAGWKETGRFRRGADIYSFDSTLSNEGVPIVFVLVSPLDSLMDELRGNRYDDAKSLGFGLTDAGGKLLYPLTIPGTELRFGIGRTPLGADALERSFRNDAAELFTAGSELYSLGAAALHISADERLFFVVAAARRGIAGRVVQDSAAMALFLLPLVGIASLLLARQIKKIHVPIARLNAAAEAFGRSEPFSLPEDEPGEMGEITRAFIHLTNRVDSWKTELQAEVDLRTKRLWLAAELCGIYAWDVTEKATIAAVNILKNSFEADIAALFYASGGKDYRFCLAGTDYPIALSENRWRECVQPHPGEDEIARFGPWTPPGVNVPVRYWISYKLYSSGAEGGYIFLGKSKNDWSESEETDLIDIARTIAPIVEIRHQRELEEEVRKETENKLAENERRLRTFVEDSRDMIYRADSEDVIREVNAAGVSILGCSEKEEIMGRRFSDFAANREEREQLLRRIQEAGYAADHEIVLRRKNGEDVYCLETAFAVRAPDGGIVELQGIVKDITERRNRENALWKTNIELAGANLKIQETQTLMIQQEKLASIGQLAAGIAHEINNPLGFLRSNHQMLRKYLKKMRDALGDGDSKSAGSPPEEKRRHRFERLYEEVESMLSESDDGFSRIMNIVSSLKNFSRDERSGEFSLYDVNAGVESTIVVARNEIKYVADVKLDLGELPPIYARGSEINQVFLNILVNAAQAIEEQKRSEKGLIEVRTYVSGETVIIEIGDDGPGIPEEIRTKVFDPFFTSKEPGKGTGLGLSISYDIVVSKHEGKLTVDSTPGNGTIFTIELPVAGPTKARDADRPLPSPRGSQ